MWFSSISYLVEVKRKSLGQRREEFTQRNIIVIVGTQIFSAVLLFHHINLIGCGIIEFHSPNKIFMAAFIFFLYPFDVILTFLTSIALVSLFSFQAQRKMETDVNRKQSLEQMSSLIEQEGKPRKAMQESTVDETAQLIYVKDGTNAMPYIPTEPIAKKESESLQTESEMDSSAQSDWHRYKYIMKGKIVEMDQQQENCMIKDFLFTQMAPPRKNAEKKSKQDAKSSGYTSVSIQGEDV
ncbi:hypothetical protein FGO68_gene2664 [Halteria grandinella]|uniref:Uncharacterized protein n=1 Tax=Halteria grandinella TaxID=5974 RepID=A0A8J8NQC5_HALGN|nr:hypothetical protein FGO68_gene2664 [Halteria grandinella]